MEFEFLDEEDEAALVPIRPLPYVIEETPQAKTLEKSSNPEYWKYKAANKLKGNPALYRSIEFPDSSLDLYSWLEQLFVLNPKINIQYSLSFYKAWNLDNVISFYLQIVAVPFFRGFTVEAASKEELIQKIEHAAKTYNTAPHELPDGVEINNVYAANLLRKNAKSTLL